jgi:hypothetical protein
MLTHQTHIITRWALGSEEDLDRYGFLEDESNGANGSSDGSNSVECGAPLAGEDPLGGWIVDREGRARRTYDLWDPDAPDKDKLGKSYRFIELEPLTLF